MLGYIHPYSVVSDFSTRVILIGHYGELSIVHDVLEVYIGMLILFHYISDHFNFLSDTPLACNPLYRRPDEL